MSDEVADTNDPSLNILINPFSRHHRAEQFRFSRGIESFLRPQRVWLGDVLATDFDAGCEHSLGR